MFKVTKKIALSLIGLLPLAGVSFAARATALDLDAESVSNAGDGIEAMLQIKSKLFEPFTAQTDFESAFKKFSSEHENVNAQDLELEFLKAVETLKQKGLLDTDGNTMISKIPSYYGA